MNEDDDTKIVKLRPSTFTANQQVCRWRLRLQTPTLRPLGMKLKSFLSFSLEMRCQSSLAVHDEDKDFFEALELKYAMVAEDNSWFMLDDGSSNNSYYNRYP